MTDIELLECTQSVYDFLIDDTDIRLNKSYNSFMEIPAFKKMNDTLIRYEFTKHSDVADMVLLTLTLNGVWKIYEQNDFRKLLRDTPKDFFSSTKSQDFYRNVLRELKLNLYLNYDN
jgi:hypothetical protein